MWNVSKQQALVFVKFRVYVHLTRRPRTFCWIEDSDGKDCKKKHNTEVLNKISTETAFDACVGYKPMWQICHKKHGPHLQDSHEEL